MEKSFIDQLKEETYDSPADALWFSVLGACGCGNSEELRQQVWQIFEIFATDNDFKKRDPLYKSLTAEILCHWLDSKKLIEHGSSIYGSWLNPKGRELYEFLLKNPNHIYVL